MKPKCYGDMYELGEEYMVMHCMGCRLFNECSRIGGYLESTVPLPPQELDTWGELKVEW